MSDIDITAPSLAELATHHSEKWRAFPSDVLPLPVAEMDFPVAAPIRETLHSMVEHSDMGYLGAIPELGSSFAAFAASRWDWTVDPARVRAATDVGVGVVEILRVVTNAGDGVLISSPVYQNFYTWINETKVKCVDVPFIHQQSEDVSLAWSIDWKGIEEAYSGGIKVHLLCSPHNPIGRI
jgi:cystathionine beta-lyase